MAVSIGTLRASIEGTDSLSPLLSRVGQNAQRFESTLNRSMTSATRSSAGLVQAVTGASVAVGGLVAGAVAVRGIAGAFSSVAGAAVTMNSTLETSTLQFGTLMGDADRAREHVKGLFEFAKRTPFETGPIIEASRKLQTFGGNALNTTATLTRLGDASAATGAPIQDLGFWVGRLYSNLQGGQPFGEAAMRLQELAVLSPAARLQMEGLQKSGRDASDVFKVFETSLDRFGGAMERQAGTWQGVTSTFTDSVNLMIASALRPLFETTRDGLGAVNRVLASPAFEQSALRVSTAIQNAFGGDSQTAIRNVGSVLLTVSEVTITAADVIGRGLSIIKLAFAGTLSVVTSLGLAWTSTMTAIAETAASIPGVGRLWFETAAKARSATEFIRGLQSSFHDQAVEALEGVKGNSAFHQTLDAGRGVVATMRNELAKMALTTRDSTAAAAGFDDGLGNVGRGALDTTVAVKKLKDAMLNAKLEGLAWAQHVRELGGVTALTASQSEGRAERQPAGRDRSLRLARAGRPRLATEALRRDEKTARRVERLPDHDGVALVAGGRTWRHEGRAERPPGTRRTRAQARLLVRPGRGISDPAHDSPVTHRRRQRCRRARRSLRQRPRHPRREIAGDREAPRRRAE